MLVLKRVISLSLVSMLLFNILIPVCVFGVNMPDFAVVDSNLVDIDNNEETAYKTAESSIKSVVTSTTPAFAFESKSQILMEATTGEVIYANNENERLLPASVTKIMTLLLIMEKIDSGGLKYTDEVRCSKEASSMGGSQIWFKEGETLTVDEALKCICVVSANDVSYAMAELVGGTHENFVQMMNNKAHELGMVNTNFMNAHGIDEEGHYTTAKDIALMSKELIVKHPDITKYTTIWMDTIRNGEFGLSSTNKLLKSYEGITGLKTGSTSQALFNLSATAEREGLSLIAVVMKAPSSAIRNAEITSLLNYGFSTYSSKVLAVKGEVIDSIYINKNIEKKINLVYEQDECVVSKKGETYELEKVVELNKNITAPLEKGCVVGCVKFVDKEGKVVKQTNVVTDESVDKSNLWCYITKIIKTYGIRGLKMG